MRSIKFLSTVDTEIELLKEVAEYHRMDGIPEKARLVELFIKQLELVSKMYQAYVPWKDRDEIMFGKRAAEAMNEYRDDNTDWDVMEECGETGWTQD